MPMGDQIGHAEIKIGDRTSCWPTNFPSGASRPQGARRHDVSLMIYLDDVDTAFKRALDAGGKVDPGMEVEGPILGRPDGHADRSVRP